MCGILFYRNILESYNLQHLYRQFKLLTHRGPDRSHFQVINGSVYGFQRLMINNLKVEGDQPTQRDDGNLILICNGEIYNHKEINPEHKGSDCEVIFDLYQKYGATAELLNNLDGVYSFILIDHIKGHLIVARDCFGVRPLFMFKTLNSLAFASEAKNLEFIEPDNLGMVKPFQPGTIETFNLFNLGSISRDQMNLRSFIEKEKPQLDSNYSRIQNGSRSELIVDSEVDPELDSEYQRRIKILLEKAVAKRVHNSDRKVGMFLSGGLDSSLVAQIASKYGVTDSFSIGLEDSSDLKSARKVAEALGLTHHEVNFTAEEGYSNLQELIWHLESYDITTIRASMPMFLLSKYIRDNTNVRVLLSGEGADELFSGYLYNHYAPSDSDLHYESLKRLSELYHYDVLRADRTTSASGLELRVPFLDKELVEYVLNINPCYRAPRSRNNSNSNSTSRKVEKYLLRNAFDQYDSADGLMPRDILWRTKEAFSDGVGHSWTDYLQHIATKLEFEGDTAVAREANMYLNIYKYLFIHKYVPKHWMPNWTSEHNGDPSASRLKVY